MKRIAIVCTLLCFLGVTALSAQNQGDMYISGSIGMNGSSSKLTAGNTTVKSPGGFQMSITPQFGYFIIDNLELHLGLGYSFTKEPDDDKSSKNTSLFVINPGVNYYLPIVENKFFYTPGLDLGIGFGAQNYIDDTSKEKLYGVTNFYVSLSLLSFEYRPVQNFGISFRAGDLTYSLMQYKQTSGNETVKMAVNNFNFGINLGASIGFRYYF